MLFLCNKCFGSVACDAPNKYNFVSFLIFTISDGDGVFKFCFYLESRAEVSGRIWIEKNWFIFYFLPIIHNSPNSILAHEQKSCCEGRKVYSNKSARKKFAYSLIMVRSCVRFLRIFNDAFYGRNSSQQATKKYKFMSVEVLPWKR